MPTLTSTLDPRSDAFQRNGADMLDEMEALPVQAEFGDEVEAGDLLVAVADLA